MIEKDNKNTDLEVFKIIIALVVIIVVIIVVVCYNINIEKKSKENVLWKTIKLKKHRLRMNF